MWVRNGGKISIIIKKKCVFDCINRIIKVQIWKSGEIEWKKSKKIIKIIKINAGQSSIEHRQIRIRISNQSKIILNSKIIKNLRNKRIDNTHVKKINGAEEKLTRRWSKHPKKAEQRFKVIDIETERPEKRCYIHRAESVEWAVEKINSGG